MPQNKEVRYAKKRPRFRTWYASLSPEEKTAWNQRILAKRKERMAGLSTEKRGEIHEKAREHRLKYKFKNPEAVEHKKSRIKNQCGRCAICFCILKKACLDHNHNTDELRDVLCSGCNSGLGFFKENIAALKSAIAYLKKHELPG